MFIFGDLKILRLGFAVQRLHFLDVDPTTAAKVKSHLLRA